MTLSGYEFSENRYSECHTWPKSEIYSSSPCSLHYSIDFNKIPYRKC